MGNNRELLELARERIMIGKTQKETDTKGRKQLLPYNQRIITEIFRFSLVQYIIGVSP